MLSKTRIAAALSLAFMIGFAPAAPGQNGASLSFSHYKLKNGLEVILSEDFSFPVVSVAVAYSAGSIHESPGKTGLAYLMEDLMFRGSTNVPPHQHNNYIWRKGGELNASATEDMTLFYETVPSNQLALVLWLESDRMKSLELTERAFEDARNSLLEDLPSRRVTVPYHDSFLAFDQLLFFDFARAHSLLGTEDDIRNLTLDDAKNFYATYYVPNNAVLCVTGSFDRQRARDLIARYFETIASRGNGFNPALQPPPPPKKQRIVKTLEDNLASAPAFHLGFRLSPPSSDEFYALRLIDYILFRGRSSRLIRRLDNIRSPLLSPASGGIEVRGNQAVYKIFATVNTPTMAEQCQSAIFSELDKLKIAYMSESELTRFKNLFKKDYLWRISSTKERAIFLTESYLTMEHFDDLPLELQRYMAVTPVEIVTLLNRYFKTENSFVVNVRTK
jgi:zinc protease